MPDAGADVTPVPPPPAPDDGGSDAGDIGTKLSPGQTSRITTDDFAFVLSPTEHAYYAVPAAGGPRQKVCDGGGSVVAAGGKALYCVTSTAGAPGPLYVWTSAHGSVKVADARSHTRRASRRTAPMCSSTRTSPASAAARWTSQSRTPTARARRRRS